MNFAWARYLDLARELAGKQVLVEGQEAKFRSAISRAYYAAFHYARDHVIAIDGPIPWDANEHDYVKRWYKKHRQRMQRQIGDDLDRLRLDRNRADYHDQWRNTPVPLSSTVDLSLTVASRIIANIGQLRQ